MRIVRKGTFYCIDFRVLPSPILLLWVRRLPAPFRVCHRCVPTHINNRMVTFARWVIVAVPMFQIIAIVVLFRNTILFATAGSHQQISYIAHLLLHICLCGTHQGGQHAWAFHHLPPLYRCFPFRKNSASRNEHHIRIGRT